MSAPLNSRFFDALAEEAAGRDDVNPRLAAALDALRPGFAVLPLHYPIDGRCSCGTDCPTPAKHPVGHIVPRGVHNASRYPNTVGLWWRRAPNANVGIACSNVAVLDVDPRHGGDETLAALEAEHGDLPQTPCCLTGGGGTHHFFKLPPGMTSFDVAPGVEIKAGKGAYVVGAGSLHMSCIHYEWADGCRPDEVPLAPMPPWLLEKRPAAGGKEGKPVGYWRELVTNGVAEGHRNSAIASLSGKLLRCHVDPVVTFELVQDWNASRCKPPLPTAEVEKIFTSIFQRELKRRGVV